MAGKYTDLLLVYQFIKRLTTPFNKTEAYNLGIIDGKGAKIRSPETSAEKNSYGYYDRMIFNLKKMLEKLPGGGSKFASYAAALFLIKEGHTQKEFNEDELMQGLYESMNLLEDTDQLKDYKSLFEDAPTNAAGAAVVGTGDDATVFKKPDARKKEIKEFLKKYLEQKNKRQKIKERKDFFKKFGL